MDSDKGEVRPGVRFRLTGLDEGTAVSFILEPGENILGTFPGNELVVRDATVSRKHAILTYDPRSATVEVRDGGSTNGTFVNGRPVARESVRPGDLVTFGALTLRLEEAQPEDVELAVSLAEADTSEVKTASARAHSTEVTGAGWIVHGVASWQKPLARFVAHLACAEPRLGLALALLLEELGVAGGALLSWPNTETPVVHAAWGEWRAPIDQVDLLRRVRRRKAPGESRDPVVIFLDGPNHLSCAVARLAGGELAALVMVGELPGGREAVPMLRTTFRLACRLGLDLEICGSPTPGSAGLSFPPGYLVCRSSGMKKAYDELAAAVESGLPVLLVGETGVGKEPLARTVHISSRRRDRNFVAINCAAIPSDLLEAELFGIGPGVATGVSARQGKVAEADGGTLFLDEIGEMPSPLQVKLLRMLQEREIQPVGSAPVRSVDVSVVSATNRPLPGLVGESGLRKDLYYRLAGCLVTVPPLRSRRDDIPALVEHLLRRSAVELGKTVRGVTVRAMDLLTAYDWPGNVRELEHHIRRMVSLCPHGQPLSAALVAEDIVGIMGRPEPEGTDVGGKPLQDRLADLERRMIVETLEDTGGNKSEAARRLGISRNGLARRMRRLGME